jgi:hypothetical protein
MPTTITIADLERAAEQHEAAARALRITIQLLTGGEPTETVLDVPRLPGVVGQAIALRQQQKARRNGHHPPAPEETEVDFDLDTKIRHALRDGLPRSTTEISRHVGCAPNTALKYLKRMPDATPSGGGHNRRWQLRPPKAGRGTKTTKKKQPSDKGQLIVALLREHGPQTGAQLAARGINLTGAHNYVKQGILQKTGRGAEAIYSLTNP